MKIKTYEDGSARLLWDWRDIALTTANFETLRAFFQAERDDALGRWRDPENPDMVCYPIAYDTDAVLVMYEGDMTRYYTTRSTWKDVTPYYVSETAGRYFAAHPKPRPPFAAYVDKNGSAVWVTDENGNLRCLSDQNLDPEKYAPFTRLLPDE